MRIAHVHAQARGAAGGAATGCGGPARHPPDPHACDDPTDDMLFSHTQQAFLEDLVQFHDRPLRFIDTSLFAAFLGTPKDSAAMEFSNRKGGFYSNLTRILATQFDMPDSACVDLDHEDIDSKATHARSLNDRSSANKTTA